jgi:hypothetical protein
MFSIHSLLGSNFLVLLLVVPAPTMPSAPGFQEPPGLGNLAVVESQVLAVLDAYMTAFNALDMSAWESTFHFPHYRLAGAGMRVLETAGLQDGADLRRRLEATGWHHSGWTRRVIVHRSADKAHVDTRFTRYRADGSELGSYESLYVLTFEDGRWGVKLRSSFAP